MTKLPKDKTRRCRRQGIALLAAIVCVSIATAVMCGLVHLATQAYRETELEQRREQAGWIAESGVERALARLTANPEYSGEQWSLSAEAIGGRHNAEVTIQVEPLEGRENWRRVRVVADYPLEPSLRVRQTREFRTLVRP